MQAMQSVRPKDSAYMALIYVIVVMFTLIIPQSFGLIRYIGTDLYFSWVVYVPSFLLVFLGVLGGWRSTIMNTVLLVLAAVLTYLLYPESFTHEVDKEIAIIEWPPKITLAYMFALLNQMRTWIKKRK